MDSTSPLAAIKKLLTNYFAAIAISAMLALLVRFYAIEAFLIPTDLMAPSLVPGDHIFVNKLAYRKLLGDGAVKRGDVIVFSFPNDPRREFIKRVIGVSGDVIEIKNGHVFLNQKSITITPEKEEQLEHVKYPISWGDVPLENKNMIQITVPTGKVFVLGDNRAKGQDSRVWGFLPVEYIQGKAWIIWFSRNWDRIFKRVL